MVQSLQMEAILAARRATSEPPARHGRYERIEEALSTELAARLRQAREEAGLSQQELGEFLGYAPTMISAFEKGRRRLKVEDLARVCIALGKEPDYFLQTGRHRGGPPIGLALRAELARLPQDDLTSALEAFLDGVDSEDFAAGVLPDLRHLRPDAAANEVVDRAGIVGPPVQMEDICEALAVPLYWRPMPDALSALVVEIGEGSYVIGINDTHPISRRRFSAAHELGHAVLRHEASYYLEFTVDDAWEPPGYRYLDEREANAFAAALLMGEQWLRRDFADGLRDVRELAERYEVSEAAMGFRLINLGLT